MLGAAALVLCCALVMAAIPAAIAVRMPDYKDRVGDDNYTEKITGLYLVEQSAAQGDNLIIYGSSELRTKEVSTHPANFFADKRCGFQVNLVGRGSCQSLIHAISIAATGDALSGQKVVLITSPQSYVPQGIAPDLFMANFSEQQYLMLLGDPDLSPALKQAISARVQTLLRRYEALPDSVPVDSATRWLAGHGAAPTAMTALRQAVLTPYYALRGYLLDSKDLVKSAALLRTVGEPSPAAAGPSAIDWAAEERAALMQAEAMTGNNTYGMLDDYYTTHIGSRLSRQRDKERDLSYSVSEEYGDLRILFEVCRQKGMDPLFVHVPLHGPWSDYTGFDAGRRQQYYDNVREITEEYGVEMLDLTANEYDEYFLCDVMHLGWKGWLAVDRALIDYYYGQ